MERLSSRGLTRMLERKIGDERSMIYSPAGQGNRSAERDWVENLKGLPVYARIQRIVSGVEFLLIMRCEVCFHPGLSQGSLIKPDDHLPTAGATKLWTRQIWVRTIRGSLDRAGHRRNNAVGRKTRNSEHRHRRPLCDEGRSR